MSGNSQIIVHTVKILWSIHCLKIIVVLLSLVQFLSLEDFTEKKLLKIMRDGAKD